ncbi:MAG: hypothetical protein IPL03_15555 [Sterolibacteriaceae bacterium]|nr:hypothetical protein [Candidatus Methylophosphatis haderslevensis]
MKPSVVCREQFGWKRFAIVLATLLSATLAQAGVYSAEDFRSGVRAYEAVYGGLRQPDPITEGSAFEFLGYVKALADSQNGSAFCLRQDAFPRAVSLLVRQYNSQPAWRDRDPAAVVIEALSRAYPCGAMPVAAQR